MFIGFLSVSKLVRFSGSSVSNSQEPVQCISLKNRPYQVKPTVVNFNGKVFINLVLISVNKCGGNCSIIADIYTRVCVPNNKEYERKSI